MRDAEALFTYVIPSDALWEDALRLAVDSGQAAYDTLFVALAVAKELKVITYDQKLLKTWPAYAITPQQFLHL